MGLTLFYDLRYPAERSREEALAAIGALRARAAQLPVGYVSPLFDLSVESDDSNESERVAGRRFLRFCAECLADPFVDDDHPRFMGNADSAFGFAVNAGDRCETATFGLIRRRADADGREEWFWWSGPKTQYASLVSEEYFVEVHCRLIAILDAAVELGFEVDVRENPLRLRSEARIDQDNANVIARLPDGHIVQAVTDKKINGFLEVETSLLGAHFHGFASADFLKPAAAVTEVPVSQPATLPPTSGIVAVNMPRKDNSVTKRTAIAGAFSLNEPNAPARTGTTPEELRSQIAAIVDYLAVDKPAHARYQPQPKATFCNVYAHDFCQLAGVYFPRVWWSAAAIEKLAQGKTVDPVLEATIDEQRANMLFRWLRDFGMRFGWRQTGDLTKLQQEVNQGAIGLIIARQKNEHRSGHVAVVVPETGDLSAKRNAAGEVIAPLQSQAGRHNFRYGNGGMNWWKSNDYAESAFWIHS